MKKVSLIFGTLIVFATVVCLLSTSAFSVKAADWPSGAAGYAKYQVIEGAIQAVDIDNDSLFIVESDILGDEPLYLSGSHTMLEDVRGVAVFTKVDIFDTFKVGDWVRATFSVIDGKCVAKNLSLIKWPTEWPTECQVEKEHPRW